MKAAEIDEQISDTIDLAFFNWNENGRSQKVATAIAAIGFKQLIRDVLKEVMGERPQGAYYPDSLEYYEYMEARAKEMGL